MAYNSRNLLLKIIEVKKITKEHIRKGATQRWIYENHIKDRFHISEATYNNYLARSAIRELKDLDNNNDTK